MTRRFTLPIDSNARKLIPLWSGFFKFFAAAIAGAAFHSHKGHAKHNNGDELFHDRSKSMDHGDCLLRHLMDASDLIAAFERGEDVSTRAILDEADALVWRACAFSQALHERFDGAPAAPAARNFPQQAKPIRTREEIDAYIAQLNRDPSRDRKPAVAVPTQLPLPLPDPEEELPQ